MNKSNLTFYNTWDLTMPEIPPRSQLYSLEPIGIGTPCVESLTSYLCRLAQAHRITVGALVSRVLALKLKRNSQNNQLYDNTTGIFASEGKALNGIGLMSKNWVEVVEEIVSVSSLRYLTMLTWAEVIPPRGLLRSTKAWCPYCYEHWHTNNLPIYEPLLWKFDVITICPQHHQHLQTQCPHCNQPFSELGHHSRPGYCSKCRQWLGSSASFRTSLTLLSPDELQWSNWSATMIGELIAITPSLTHPISRNRVSDAISSCTNQLSNNQSKNLSAFAKKIQVSVAMVWHWQRGQKLITLDKLLQICYTFKISIVDFLTRQVVINKLVSDEKNNQSQSCSRPGRGPRRSPQEIEKIRNTLKTILEDEYPPPTFKDVQQRFPKICLRHFFPILCQSIVQRHAHYVKNTRLQNMKKELEAILESQEFPPPSMTDALKYLSYGESALRRHFPDLCHSISERYTTYVQSQKAQRTQELCKSIKETTYFLHSQGIYPSSNRVLSELGLKMGYLLHPDAQAALQEARQDLEFFQKKTEHQTDRF
jgi:transcriptional regulator with XRE-family HTH domain